MWLLILTLQSYPSIPIALFPTEKACLHEATLTRVKNAKRRSFTRAIIVCLEVEIDKE